MRGSLLINKLWNGFLKRKMEREMVKAVDIEDAFQRIKAATVRYAFIIGFDRCVGYSP